MIKVNLRHFSWQHYTHPSLFLVWSCALFYQMARKKFIWCVFKLCNNNSKNSTIGFYYFRKHDAQIWRDSCENPALDNISLENFKSAVWWRHIRVNVCSVLQARTSWIPNFSSISSSSISPRLCLFLTSYWLWLNIQPSCSMCCDWPLLLNCEGFGW